MTNKEIELKLIEKIVEKLDTNRFEQQKISNTCEADLVVFDKVKYKFYCAEVKNRSYSFDFFKKNGTIVETNKLLALMNKFAVTELTLFTITSDNYVLKSKVNLKTDKIKKIAKRTTCSTIYNNYTLIEKEFYVTKDFEVVYKLNNDEVEDYR